MTTSHDFLPEHILAKPITAILADRGIAAYDTGPRSLIYDMTAQPPARLTRQQIGPVVRELAVELLRDAVSDDELRRNLRDSAEYTLGLIETNGDGAASYLIRVERLVRDRLPQVEHEDVAPPKAQPRTSAEARRDKYADENKRITATTTKVLTAMLDRLPPGKYELRDLWDLWKDLLLDDPDAAPELLACGRTTFYRLLNQLGDVRNGGKHRRYLHVHDYINPPT